jgi:hypothetical protein
MQELVIIIVHTCNIGNLETNRIFSKYYLQSLLFIQLVPFCLETKISIPSNYM